MSSVPGRYAILAMLLLGISVLPMLGSGGGGGPGVEPGQPASTQSPGASKADQAEPPGEGWVTGQQVKYDGKSMIPFTVQERKPELEAYPCEDCHEDEPANPRERKLVEEHEAMVLDHGRDRFWCLTCHGKKDKNSLVSLKGKKIDFNQSYLLCGQCHFQRQKDWYFGGHGKRQSGWQFPRQITMCVECHDPHSPSIKPFEAVPPPLVRKGLEKKSFPPAIHVRIWDPANNGEGRH